MQSAIPPISFQISAVFIAFSYFWIMRYIIVSRLQHAALFESVTHISILLNNNKQWVRSPLGVVLNCIVLIYPSSVFSTPKEISPWELLKPSMRPYTHYRRYQFSCRIEIRSNTDRKDLKPLNLVQETAQTYQGEKKEPLKETTNKQRKISGRLRCSLAKEMEITVTEMMTYLY